MHINTEVITRDEFGALLTKNNGIMLFKFGAEWCGPCKKIENLLHELLESNPDVKYTKIDIDENPELTESYSVKGVPTFIGMYDNEVVNRIVGAVPLAKLEGIFKDND